MVFLVAYGPGCVSETSVGCLRGRFSLSGLAKALSSPFGPFGNTTRGFGRDLVAYCAQATGVSATLTQDKTWCTYIGFHTSAATPKSWAKLIQDYHHL